MSDQIEYAINSQMTETIDLNFSKEYAVFADMLKCICNELSIMKTELNMKHFEYFDSTEIIRLLNELNKSVGETIKAFKSIIIDL